MTELLFAAIADDVTGGSDLAGMLFGQGVRTVQTFGIPGPDEVTLMARYDAVVVSLKTRSIEPSAAVAESLAAHRALGPLRPKQWQFKYCSTFDSTPRGNIGPVTAALMEATGAGFTIAVPALPVNGRTQYQGNLFVLGELLAESPMRSHPLNPMTDSNLVRWLQAQTSKRVGLVPWSVVSQSAAAIAAKAAELQQSGVAIALVDAITDRRGIRDAAVHYRRQRARHAPSPFLDNATVGPAHSFTRQGPGRNPERQLLVGHPRSTGSLAVHRRGGSAIHNFARRSRFRAGAQRPDRAHQLRAA